jgi:hypothetical protein
MPSLPHCARLETKGVFCFQRIADRTPEAKAAGHKVRFRSLKYCPFAGLDFRSGDIVDDKCRGKK